MPDATTLYAGLAALLLAGLWIVFKSGDPKRLERGSFGEKLQPRAPTKREQLLKARADVKHQLAIQTLARHADDAGVRQELGEILGEIDAELAETPPDDHVPGRGLKS